MSKHYARKRNKLISLVRAKTDTNLDMKLPLAQHTMFHQPLGGVERFLLCAEAALCVRKTK